MAGADGSIGPYSVVREIGRGGMGVVYQARDARLGRDVAIKALPAELATDRERLARFEREAQSLARLNHPNVATIYGLEEHGDSLYLVLEYVEGEDLASRIARGPLPVEEAVELAAQVADALAVAHEQQIIHRDVKPANIMVNERGQAKMLDFGLAKFLPGHELAGDEAASGPMTHTGAVLGTFNYMAPEQARGQAVDARADVFALGAVLYEMVTATKSFDGPSVPAVFDALLNRDPRPPSQVNPAVLPAVEAIIEKALRKDRDERYASAAELRADLQRVQQAMAGGAPPPPPPRSRRTMAVAIAAVVALVAVLVLAQRGEKGPAADRIRLAVLPFDDLAADPAQKYFAEGMANEIIGALGRLRPDRLGVMGYISSRRFPDPESLRDELDVDFVVDGTVKRHGDTVYVNVELVDARDLVSRWTQPFQGKLDNVPRLQREIARRLARELAVELLPDAQAPYEPGPEAYDRYLRGRYWLYQTDADAFEKAAREFEEATRLEPDFARAHAAAARAYVFWSTWNTVPADHLRRPARRHAAAALRLNDQLPAANTANAVVQFILEWNLDEARRSFERALELAPSAGDVHHWYGHLLGALGRHDEAVREFQKALELDNLSPFHRSCMGIHQIFDGKLADAEASLTWAQELAPGSALVFQNWGLWYERQGHRETATAVWKQARERLDIPWFRALVGYGLGREGKTAEARDVLADFEARVAAGEYVGELEFARVYAGVGDKDEAFRRLERAYERREAWLICLPLSVGYDTLRDDPRYDALLKRLGLRGR